MDPSKEPGKAPSKAEVPLEGGEKLVVKKAKTFKRYDDTIHDKPEDWAEFGKWWDEFEADKKHRKFIKRYGKEKADKIMKIERAKIAKE